MEDKRWKILLPDDVDLILELDRTFLHREGFELVVAGDGAEALVDIRRERPAVIVLDLAKPGMDAAGVCRAVKSDPELRATPVLIVGAGNSRGERACCEQAGCDGFLPRPVPPDLLLAAVRGRLGLVEREAHRVPARLRISMGEDAGEVLTDFTVNVSLGGVFVETARPFAAGDPLRTSFVLPGREQPVSCRSRVAWVNTAERPTTPSLPPGIGLQFLDLSDEDRAAILAFVKGKLLSPLW